MGRTVTAMIMATALFLIQGGCVRETKSFRLYDVALRQTSGISSQVERMAEADLVLLGESHDNPEHHMGQLAVIAAMHEAGKPIAVGLEMFQRQEQEVLDAWVAGRMSEEEMQIAFARNWGEMWPLYRDIFIYCRDRNIPMLGLNVPREITRQVAREGFGSLSGEQLGRLPAIACDVTPEYEGFLRRVLGGHGSEKTFTNFCEAQLVWDTAMAVHSLEYLKAHPGETVVILCGYIHAWRPGIPDQAAKLDPEASSEVVLPFISDQVTPETVSLEDADFLLMQPD